MIVMITASFALISFDFASSSHAQIGLFGPSDYDECILEGMQGVYIRRGC